MTVPATDSERLDTLRRLQVIIERLVRDDYAVRVKPLPFTLQDALSPRCIALPFTLAAGETVKRMELLTREIALACKAAEASIERDAYGLWVVLPRPTPQDVLLGDYILDKAAPKRNATAALGIAALGVDLHNKLVAWDVIGQPHTLLVGTSNAGKSNTLLGILVSMAYWYTPRQVQFYVLDGKGGESFAALDERVTGARLKHLKAPIMRDPDQMLDALRDVIAVMERRYAVAETTTLQSQTAIIVIVDELAEILKSGGDLLESALSTILQKGRAARIHVVASSPKADVAHLHTLASLFNGRIVMKTVRPSDSYLAANTSGSSAHRLSLKGDMFVGTEMRRVQGFLVTKDDITKLLSGSMLPRPVRNGPWLAAALPNALLAEPVPTTMLTEVAVATNALAGGLRGRPVRTKQSSGRPTKPITDAEVAAVMDYYATSGKLPTISMLVKGHFFAGLSNGHEVVSKGCVAQGRAERLLKLAAKQVEKQTEGQAEKQVERQTGDEHEAGQ